MMTRWKAILAAFATASVVTLAGVLVLLDPISKTDSAGVPLVHPLAGFLVYVLSTVALFDWTASQMRSAFRAAFVIAASQFLLVNVDFVLSGKRGVMTAVASTLLLALTGDRSQLCIRAFARGRLPGARHESRLDPERRRMGDGLGACSCSFSVRRTRAVAASTAAGAAKAGIGFGSAPAISITH